MKHSGDSHRGRPAGGPRERGGASGTDDPRDLDPDTPGEPAAVEPAAPSEAPADLKDRWLRAEAELQNARRRAQRDREEAVRFAEDRVLLEVLSFIDDLERALEAAATSGAPESWTQGVRLAANRMQESLARHGVVPLAPLGQPFDPRFHEALLEVDETPEAPAGAVAQVLRTGYRRDDRVLRPARVAVARSVSPEEA